MLDVRAGVARDINGLRNMLRHNTQAWRTIIPETMPDMFIPLVGLVVTLPGVVMAIWYAVMVPLVMFNMASEFAFTP